MQKKIFLGHKLRRLREQRGQTQAALAQGLGLSPSYLNQIENNQRPLTLPVLLKVVQILEVDLATFAEDDEARLTADLREAMADPLFAGAPLNLAELRNVVAASPAFARSVLSLHQAYQKLGERFQSFAETFEAQPGAEMGDGAQFPYEEVRDYFHYKNNYIDRLDEAAERYTLRGDFHIGEMQADLIGYLKQRHDVRVRIVPDDVEDAAMRRFDAASGTLFLSSQLSASSRNFHLANQIALLSERDTIEDLVAEAKLTSDDARAICRVGLANYFAGALILPYRAFLGDARAVRHDVERLQRRFGASFEQVCHRLSTLQRPNARGIPFYFFRVDMAGNITKRHSATRFHFARFGGACPLWNVHEAFAQPGKILVQLARMPDGVKYVCMARTTTKPGGAYRRPTRAFAIGLGCEAEYAAELVYAAGLDLADEEAPVPIGVNCRICERTDCQQRAFPAFGHRITVEPNERSFVPYVSTAR
ncbi:MAG: DUF2083 domain-containing protein [Alphaproteobacteria bacterium]|jgi:predicted transcriptional regulator/DNA-binding XRE family transcriptional regulator|nr:DUF2083 domain-containing protein [Alphaproteobacteria bacterium]